MSQMVGQIALWDIDPQLDIIQNFYPKSQSKCVDCYWECKGKCACWNSQYEDMDIPMDGCMYFDGVTGGIPLDELV